MKSRVAINQSIVLGALVADAATLGFEWLYDPARIAAVAPTTPEFHEPNSADFEGTMGFFIGDGKRAGDLSHYGEQVLASVRAVRGSEWNPSAFLSEFQRAFERGGTFSGYIDGCTNGTLDNIKSMTSDAVRAAVASQNLNTDQSTALTKLLLGKIKWVPHDRLASAVAADVEKQFNDPTLTEKASKAATYFTTHPPLLTGADDNQISGLVKLPPVVAVCAGTPSFDAIVETAIRTTNNNDEAVEYGLFAARILQSVLLDPTVSVAAAVEEALTKSTNKFGLHAAVKAAMQLDVRNIDAPSNLSAKFGHGSCPVANTVPITVAIATALNMTFVEAIRINIYVGGDSSGRAVLLGALFGASQGVPNGWAERLTHHREITDAIHRAFP